MFGIRTKFMSGIAVIELLAAVCCSSGHAASNGGQTAADFLLIGVGASSAGMGGAYTALSEGAMSAFYNPAGLGGSSTKEVVVGHFAWFQDITLEHGSFAFALNDKTSLSASIVYLNYGTIKATNSLGAIIGEISAYDLVAGISVGSDVSDKLAVGLTAKLINQRLDNFNSATPAIDLGFRYDLGRADLAAVVSNLGGKIKFEGVEENLPTKVTVGLAGKLFSPSLLSSIDFEKRVHGDIVIRHGFEYNHDQQYFVRGGYNYFPQDDSRNLGSGLSFGAGVILNQMQIDYAVTLGDKYSPDDLHRFSVLFSFH